MIRALSRTAPCGVVYACTGGPFGRMRCTGLGEIVVLSRAAMALIFRPGFSTQEEVSMDAGRGVGMDVVARSVYALGGKIGVSTNPGKFTRFKIVLPAAEAANSGAAVAAV